MKINEAAKMTGVTIRTLHYYDQIGLLRPETVTDAGYRLYGEKIVAREYPMSFSIALACKDMRYAAAMLKDGQSLPLMEAGLAQLERACAAGLGGADLARLAQLTEQRLEEAHG